jgi:hypothetical protein
MVIYRFYYEIAINRHFHHYLIVKDQIVAGKIPDKFTAYSLTVLLSPFPNITHMILTGLQFPSTGGVKKYYFFIRCL